MSTIKFQQANVLKLLLQKKINKLVNKYDFIVRADVYFEAENTSNDQTGRKTKIQLSAPGPRLYAEESKEKFEISLAEVINQLDRQLQKRKGKMKTH